MSFCNSIYRQYFVAKYGKFERSFGLKNPSVSRVIAHLIHNGIGKSILAFCSATDSSHSVYSFQLVWTNRKPLICAQMSDHHQFKKPNPFESHHPLRLQQRQNENLTRDLRPSGRLSNGRFLNS